MPKSYVITTIRDNCGTAPEILNPEIILFQLDDHLGYAVLGVCHSKPIQSATVVITSPMLFGTRELRFTTITELEGPETKRHVCTQITDLVAVLSADI